jgi:hypothetical protein
MTRTNRFGALPLILLAACDTSGLGLGTAEQPAVVNSNSGSRNLHLQDTVRFNHVQPGADKARGRARFGLAADGVNEDKSQALFEGFSQEFGGVVVSNRRTCFTCHRGSPTNLGFPATPLSSSIPLTDELFTGIDADAQGDPDGFTNLDQHALIKYRPGRFNMARPADDPFRQVFFWRKSIRLVNTAFQRGFLNDGRMRMMRETDRGAVFSHTQESDGRFGDLFSEQDADDMEAFQFLDTLSDPQLAALLDPDDPMFEVLASNPFYTVPVTTDAQRRGRDVFVANCMSCHNVPNVFNNLSNVDPLGGVRGTNDPAFGPGVGRAFDVGISERNRLGLRFTRDMGDGTFQPIVIGLARETGGVVQHTITFDIGLAAVTAREADIGRFKVPQLRKIKDLGPYFHDASVATLAEVIEYFDSAEYNTSKDGRTFPIDMSAQEKRDLLEFLLVL